MPHRATSRSMLAATAATALVMVGVWLTWIAPYVRSRAAAHPHRTLHVRVVEEGHPDRGIAGAWVQALPVAQEGEASRSDSRTPSKSARTDSAGQATMERVPRGEAYIQVKAIGFVIANRRLPPEDGSRTEVVVALARGLEIAGRVRKDDGTPAVGAVVRGTQRTQWQQFKADSAGAFRSSGFLPGLVALHATWGDEAAVWEGDATGDAGVQDAEVRLRVEPTRRRIRLLLKGEDGLPVASAQVNAKNEELMTSFQLSRVHKLVKGEAVVPANPAVQWLSIDSPEDEFGIALPWAPVLIGPLGARGGDLEVVMTGGHTLTGTVRDEAGKPVEGVSVNVMPLAVEGGREAYVFEDWWHAKTDADGRYTVERVSPGRVQVDAQSLTGKNWPKSDVTVPSAPVDLVLRGLRVLKGSLHHSDGSPAPEGVLYRQGTAEDPKLASWTQERVAPDGSFELWTFGPATIHLRAGLVPTGPEEMGASEVTADAAAEGVLLTVARGTDVVVHLPDWPTEEMGFASLQNGPYSRGVSKRFLGTAVRFEGIDPRAPLALHCGPTRDGRIGFSPDILAAGPQATVTLVAGRTVRGRARGFPEDARPKHVWADSGQFESVGELTPDGSFRVVGIPSGPYRVCVVFGRGDEYWAGSAVSAGDEAPLAIELSRKNTAEFIAWVFPRR